MINLKNQKFNQIKLVEILFCMFPLSFIAGNLILTLNLIIFIILSLFVIKKEKLPLKIGTAHWLLIAFFLYLLLSTTIQFQMPGFLNEKTKDWPLESQPYFKSITLLRYLVLFFIVDILFVNKIINLKKLFIFSLICTSFVCIDIFIQYFSGTDIFGYTKNSDRISGPFGDEYIAGSYLLKFSFFSFFGFLALIKNKKYTKYFLIIIMALHIFAVTLTGNRMPLVLFLFGFFLAFILVKNLRFIIFCSLFAFLVMFGFLSKYDKNFSLTYSAFFSEINILKQNNNKQPEKPAIESKETVNMPKILHGRRDWLIDTNKFLILGGSGHRSIFQTSLWVWKMNPITGFGLKSFRVKCWDILTMVRNSVFAVEANLNCATHSHNYYLEILVEAGIIGLFILFLFFIVILKNSYLYLKKYYQTNSVEIYLLIPIIIIFLVEIWPLKSSGSFFTTWNATYLWLYVPLLTTYQKKLI